MSTPDSSFDTNYNLAIVHVEKLPLPGQEVYRVDFSNEVPTITVSCSTNGDGDKYWDTVPPGNHELASVVGRLIEAHPAESGKR